MQQFIGTRRATRARQARHVLVSLTCLGDALLARSTLLSLFHRMPSSSLRRALSRRHVQVEAGTRRLDLNGQPEVVNRKWKQSQAAPRPSTLLRPGRCRHQAITSNASSAAGRNFPADRHSDEMNSRFGKSNTGFGNRTTDSLPASRIYDVPFTPIRYDGRPGVDSRP